MRTRNQMESGRTMLEMLGVLAIMGVIMYGAIAGISFGVDMYKVNAIYTEVNEVAAGIIDLYSWTKEYPEGTKMATAICNNDVIDKGSCSSKGNTVEGGAHPFNVDRSGNGPGNGFMIMYSGLSDLICGRLLAQSYTNVRPMSDEKCESALTSCENSTIYFCSY